MYLECMGCITSERDGVMYFVFISIPFLQSLENTDIGVDGVETGVVVENGMVRDDGDFGPEFLEE